jgi:ABC-type arginine transport system permease subunit
MKRGERLARLSLLALLGVPVGIVFLTVWAVHAKTSPTVADEERIRGWGTVVRELPATAFLFMVVFVGFVLAVRERCGCTRPRSFL